MATSTTVSSKKKKSQSTKKSTYQREWESWSDALKRLYNEDTKNGTVTWRDNLAKMGYNSLSDMLNKVE